MTDSHEVESLSEEAKRDLQRRAGIPNLPTDLTYHARMAMAGEGDFAFEWKDKPHRLVYRLCQHIEAQTEALEAQLKLAKDAGIERAAQWHDGEADYYRRRIDAAGTGRSAQHEHYASHIRALLNDINRKPTPEGK